MTSSARKESMSSNAQPDLEPIGPPPIPGLGKTKLPQPLEQRRLKLLRSSESPDFGNLWAAVTPAGLPFEAVLEPRFWSNHATRLHIGDSIEIHTDDQSYFGRLLVRHLGGAAPGKTATEADVAQLEYHAFGQIAPVEDAAATHKVEHRGPHLQHCVVRLRDQKIVSDGHSTKEAAEAALKALLRVG
jgi:hypothetical protein